MGRFTVAGALVLGAGLLGVSSAGATTFTNPAPIAISTGAAANATPYPSQITVSGVPGPITDVNVKLNGFSHTRPNDLALALVGPGGQALMLGNGAGNTVDAVDLNMTVDDAAPAPFPDDAVLASTSYRPSSYYAGTNFPSPGPLTAYGNPGPNPAGSATLASTYNGQPANGVWSLFVGDYAVNEGGQFASGWGLTIEPSPALTAPITTPAPPATTRGKCRKKPSKRSSASAKRKCKKKRKK